MEFLNTLSIVVPKVQPRSTFAGGALSPRWEPNWKKGDSLGETSAFGQVFRDSSDPNACVKVFPFNNKKEVKAFGEREVDILRDMNHKNIVKYIGHEYNEKTDELKIRMELVEGVTLRQFMVQGPVDRKMILHIIAQLIDVLLYFSQKKIVHLDMKLDNVMVLESGHVKVIDFGSARRIVGVEMVLESDAGIPVGVAAKEVREGTCGLFSDVFSVGMIFLALIKGGDVAVHKWYKSPVIPGNVSKPVNEFLVKSLKDEYEERWTAEEMATFVLE